MYRTVLSAVSNELGYSPLHPKEGISVWAYWSQIEVLLWSVMTKTDPL